MRMKQKKIPAVSAWYQTKVDDSAAGKQVPSSGDEQRYACMASCAVLFQSSSFPIQNQQSDPHDASCLKHTSSSDHARPPPVDDGILL